jgi:hypothetical protein
LRAEHVSLRNSRRIPIAWRNARYNVNCVAKTEEVACYLVKDQMQGLNWMINDVSKVTHSAERGLYLDRFSEVSPVGPPSGAFGSKLSAKYRHPSLEELITLWESEPYLCSEHFITNIFDKSGVYWIGDRLEDRYLCCSFGPVACSYPELKLLDAREDSSGRKIHLYELLGKYGMVKGAPYRALSAYIVEDEVEVGA